MGVKEWFSAFTGASADEVRRVDPAILADPVHIRVRDVHKHYGPHHVLKGLSFDIVRGKTNVIIGPSGSGKTVLMRQLIRLEKPDSGQILVNERDFVQLEGMELDAMRRTMGMVFQMSALFDSMTVFENVAFPLREHANLSDGMVRDIVLMKLNAVGLRGARHLMPSEISGGMARRVALARAMALDPELMLYDEPFAGLDPISMGVAARLIRELNDTMGLTSIIVSHDVEETFLIADHVVLLANGRIVAQGNALEPVVLRG